MWGEDALILSSDALRKPYLARAMTHTQCRSLQRSVLHELAQCFPEAYRSIRRATMILALKRKIMTAYRTGALHRVVHGEDSPSAKKKGFDFVDAMMVAHSEKAAEEIKQQHPELSLMLARSSEQQAPAAAPAPASSCHAPSTVQVSTPGEALTALERKVADLERENLKLAGKVEHLDGTCLQLTQARDAAFAEGFSRGYSEATRSYVGVSPGLQFPREQQL